MNENRNKSILSLEDILEEEDLDRTHSEKKKSEAPSDGMALPAPRLAEAVGADKVEEEMQYRAAPHGVMSVSPSKVKIKEDREELYPTAVSATVARKSDSAEDVFDYRPVVKNENTDSHTFGKADSIAMPIWDDEPLVTDTADETDEDDGYFDAFSPITKGAERAHGECTDEKEEAAEEESTDISDYTEEELRSLVKRLCRTDVDCIRESYERELSRLRLEYSEAKLRFEKDEDSSLEDEIFERISATEREQRRAIKREKKYNKRIFFPILTDYREANLHPSADRELLLELRAKLLARLIERDGYNRELIALTSRKGKRRSQDGYAAELGGRARAYKKQKKVDKLIHKYNVSAKETRRLYALMDEYIECSARLAHVKYVLKEEDPSRIMERSLKKERKKLRSTISKLDDHIDYYKVRAIERALGKKKAGIRTGAIWIGIALLAGLVLSLLANLESLLALFS